MKQRIEKNGTKVNDWATPDLIYDYINKKFFKGNGFYDPCPLNAIFDGLIGDWKKQNYVNPPYNPAKLKEAFIKKAYEQYKKNNFLSVLLIPASTETKIFHDLIVPNAKVILIKKRIMFKGINTKGEYVTNKSGQSGSMFIIFGEGHKVGITTLIL